jgi:hypothetical protein
MRSHWLFAGKMVAKASGVEIITAGVIFRGLVVKGVTTKKEVLKIKYSDSSPWNAKSPKAARSGCGVLRLFQSLLLFLMPLSYCLRRY